MNNSKQEVFRILVIEDNYRDMAEYFDNLNPYRFSIDRANGINQAIDRVDGDGIKNYDLIILDIMMPIETLEEQKESLPLDDPFSSSSTDKGLLTGLIFFDHYLKNKPAGQPVPVIYLTAGRIVSDEIITHFRGNRKQVLHLLWKKDTDLSEFKEIIEKWSEQKVK